MSLMMGMCVRKLRSMEELDVGMLSSAVSMKSYRSTQNVSCWSLLCHPANELMYLNLLWPLSYSFMLAEAVSLTPAPGGFIARTWPCLLNSLGRCPLTYSVNPVSSQGFETLSLMCVCMYAFY